MIVRADEACEYGCYGLIPDVIDEPPPATLRVVFPRGARASCGNELTPSQTKDAPVVEAPVHEDGRYTLAMVDPDVPSRRDPRQGQFLHWLVVNVPGRSIREGGDLSDGRPEAGYIPPAPAESTGLHRYVFLVYRQGGAEADDDDDVIPATSSRGRFGFDVGSYAEEHGLGRPVAGNFIQAQYDDYVPAIRGRVHN